MTGWLTLVTMLSIMPTTVLCIGGDGHVALEPAHHGHCAEGAEAHDQDGSLDAGSRTAREACSAHSCTDLSLTLGWSTRPLLVTTLLRLQFDAQPYPPAAAIRHAADSDFSARQDTHWNRPLSGLTPSLIVQRTIVLRV